MTFDPKAARAAIRIAGRAAADDPATLVAADGKARLRYVPFEHVARGARLVLVGITPGPTQIALAYDAFRDALRAGADAASAGAAAKRAGAFGGGMRERLVRMLDATGITAQLGLSSGHALWAERADLLHATSVVPHAAFLGDKMFAGTFAAILATPIFRACYERDFLPELDAVPADALFVALGPTPLAALDACVAEGRIAPERVLGALAHPSPAGGTAVAVYCGDRAPEDLEPKDPVRARAAGLLAQAARLRAAVAALSGAAPPPAAPPSVRAPAASVEGLHAVVSRGRDVGLVLRPHVQDGAHIVSRTRFEKDYVRLPLHEPLEPWLARGYSLRMSAPGRAPSLIAPASIRGWTR